MPRSSQLLSRVVQRAANTGLSTCTKSDRKNINNIEQINAAPMCHILEGAIGESKNRFGGNWRKAVAWCKKFHRTINPEFFSPASLKIAPYHPGTLTNLNTKIDGWGYTDGVCATAILIEKHYGAGKLYEFGKKFSKKILSGQMTPKDISKMMGNEMYGRVSDWARTNQNRAQRLQEEDRKDKIVMNTMGQPPRQPGVSKDPIKSMSNALADPKIKPQILDYLSTQRGWSDQEITIFSMLLDGATMAEIGQAIGTSEGQTKSLVRRLKMKKMKRDLAEFMNNPPAAYSDLAQTIQLRYATLKNLLSIKAFKALLHD